MRPPRVYEKSGKYYVNINNTPYLLNTKLRDIDKIQQFISSQIHVYENKKYIGKGQYDTVDRDLKHILKSDYIHDGLSNRDIETIMQRLGAYEHGFRGVIPIDRLHLIRPSKKPFSVIVNTDRNNEPGTHWIAIYIDPMAEKEIDIFDSFGRDFDDIEPRFEQDLLSELKQLVDKMNLPYMLKMKMNYLQWQPFRDKFNNVSTTCGFHAMNFLLKRIYKGETFEQASGMSDMNRNITYRENELESLKQAIINRRYI